MTDPVANAMNEAGAIKLASMADADSVKALYAALAERRGADVDIDGADVAFLSALAGQTLLAAQEAWRQDGRRFAIVEPSGALSGDLELLGLSSLLEPVEAGEADKSDTEAGE